MANMSEFNSSNTRAHPILFCILLFVLPIYWVNGEPSYPLQCPTRTQWKFREKAMCNESLSSYYCIFDKNNFKYKEWCYAFGEFQSAGFRFVLRGGLDGEKCGNNRFQPFSFLTEGNSDCVFDKSRCTEEGQVLENAGSTVKDVSCRCDYTRGYAFVQPPRSGCACNTRTEDCSCYLKKCQFNRTLTKDYTCVSIDIIHDHDDDKNNCPHIEKLNINSNDTDTYVTLQENVKDQFQNYNRKAALALICFPFIFIGFYLVVPHVLKLIERSMKIKEMRKLHDRTISHWQFRDELFTESYSTQLLMEQIKGKHIITIVGPSGVGKSMAVRHVVLKFSKMYSYEILICSNPEEIETCLNKKSRKILVFDEYQNSNNIIHLMRRFSLILEKNITLINNSEIKIVLISPEEYWKCSPESSSVLSETKFHIFPLKENITKEQFNAELYLSTDELKEVRVKNSYDRHPLFFILCQLYKQNKREKHVTSIKKFFSDPRKTIFLDLQSEMQKRDKSAFACLVLFVIYNNCITEQLMSDDSELIFTLSAMRTRLNNKEEFTLNIIREKLYYLCSTYVRRLNNNYILASEELFEIILKFCKDNLLKQIIEIAKPEAIRDIFLVESVSSEGIIPVNTTKSLILLEQKYESMYYRRLCQDIMDEHTLEVFTNKHFLSSKFCETIIEVFNKNIDVIHSLRKLSNNFMSPLLLICKHGFHNLIYYFIGLKFFLDVRNSDGATPIFLAAGNGHLKTVQILLDLGADIKICTKKRESPIYTATCNGFQEIVKMLLEHGADPNTFCYQIRTPLYVACLEGYCEIVELLIKNGANVNTCNVANRSPLHAAVESGYINIVEKLLDSQCQVDIFDKWGYTPLIIAIQEEHSSIVKLMLKTKVSSNICNLERESPLLFCSKIGNKEICRILLEHHADPNICSFKGETPLVAAIEAHNTEIAKLLIENGANVWPPCKREKSPFYVARKNELSEIIIMILEK